MANKAIKAADFDARFEAGEDIEPHLNPGTAHRPGLGKRRVNVDFSDWMVRRLDEEAARRGVTRQSLIKMWVADRLDAAA